MVVIITGASHTGKTLLSQKLLEKYKYPYLSIDHLKMGLIRSNYTHLTPLSDDDKLTKYLWPVIREIIKTAIENNQNLIVEGCYVPFDWAKDFSKDYLDNIRYYCLVMSNDYIKNNFEVIKKYSEVIEQRKDEDFTMEWCLKENSHFLEMAKKYKVKFILIDKKYSIDIDL